MGRKHTQIANNENHTKREPYENNEENTIQQYSESKLCDTKRSKKSEVYTNFEKYIPLDRKRQQSHASVAKQTEQPTDIQQNSNTLGWQILCIFHNIQKINMNKKSNSVNKIFKTNNFKKDK